MNYVLAVATQFNSGAKMVSLKARGRAISKAVDVTEIVRNRFMKDLKVDGIRIGTVNLQDEERAEGINVSWIEIDLLKDHDDNPPHQVKIEGQDSNVV